MCCMLLCTLNSASYISTTISLFCRIYVSYFLELLIIERHLLRFEIELLHLGKSFVCLDNDIVQFFNLSGFKSVNYEDD